MGGRWNPQRRRFLRGAGAVIGGAALARKWTGRNFWEVPLRAASGPYDPIPDPIAAGWTAENVGCGFVAAQQLQITDTSTALGVGLNFFFSSDATTLFAQDRTLTPHVEMSPGYLAAPDSNLGIHVTINDGINLVRAVLLDNGDGSTISVALVAPNSQTGYTVPLRFGALAADF